MSDSEPQSVREQPGEVSDGGETPPQRKCVHCRETAHENPEVMRYCAGCKKCERTLIFPDKNIKNKRWWCKKYIPCKSLSRHCALPSRFLTNASTCMDCKSAKDEEKNDREQVGWNDAMDRWLSVPGNKRKLYDSVMAGEDEPPSSGPSIPTKMETTKKKKPSSSSPPRNDKGPTKKKQRVSVAKKRGNSIKEKEKQEEDPEVARLKKRISALVEILRGTEEEDPIPQ